MSVTLLPAAGLPGLLELYVDHQHLLGGAPSWRRERVAAAREFLHDHPDLDVWMAGELDSRLVELKRRRPGTWPFVGFAILTGACHADADFLFAKNFGHSMARWTAGLFPDDVAALSEAATRLGVPDKTATAWLRRAVPLAVAFTGQAPSMVTVEDLDALDVAVATTQRMTANMRRGWSSYVFGLRQLLFEARITDDPAVRRRGGGRATREARLAVVAAPDIRRTLLAYIDARTAVLRPKSIEKLTSALAIFGEFLSIRFPELTSTADLERRHIDAFMTWTATRPGRGNHHHVLQVGPATIAHAVITLRTFLDDIAAWGWAQSPPRRLVFPTDIPHQPELLPRALPPDIDAAVMAAVAGLADPFARTGLTIMRGTGLRIGELLDLELDCIVDYGPSGSWLRVPLGKLNNERAVPLDAPTLAVLDSWFDQRQHQRALPHPRDGRLADFVFVERGRHLGPSRLQSGLRHAVTAAGLTGTDGRPLRVVSHQLRHCYATSLSTLACHCRP